MEESERRQALADFLRTRRARLSHAEVGLPARKQTTFSSNLRVQIYAASPSTASRLEQALSASSG
jgi:hypothetical protein